MFPSTCFKRSMQCSLCYYPVYQCTAFIQEKAVMAGAITCQRSSNTSVGGNLPTPCTVFSHRETFDTIDLTAVTSEQAYEKLSQAARRTGVALVSNLPTRPHRDRGPSDRHTSYVEYQWFGVGAHTQWHKRSPPSDRLFRVPRTTRT